MKFEIRYTDSQGRRCMLPGEDKSENRVITLPLRVLDDRYPGSAISIKIYTEEEDRQLEEYMAEMRMTPQPPIDEEDMKHFEELIEKYGWKLE